MIDKKRQEVFDELQHIEERMKKNFELRKTKDTKEEVENHEEAEKNEENGDMEMLAEEKHEDNERDELHGTSCEEKNSSLEQEPSNGTEEVQISDGQSAQEENWDGEILEDNKEENLSEVVTEKTSVHDGSKMEVDDDECL
jgi:hypothetical protein